MSLPGLDQATWAPCDQAFAITPDDKVALPIIPRGVYVGVGGDVNVDMATTGVQIGAVLFKNVPAGTVLPIRVRAVRSTLTTATNLIGIY